MRAEALPVRHFHATVTVPTVYRYPSRPSWRTLCDPVGQPRPAKAELSREYAPAEAAHIPRYVPGRYWAAENSYAPGRSDDVLAFAPPDPMCRMCLMCRIRLIGSDRRRGIGAWD